MKRQTILLVIAPLFANLLYGQNLMEIDSFQEKYVDDFHQTGYLYFQQNKLAVGEPYQIYQDATGDTLNQLQLLDHWQDSTIGMHHYKYQQFYKGLRVEAAIYTEHAENGFLHYANGKIVDGLNASANPDYGRKEALEQLLLTMPNHQFAWEIEEWENSIKNDTLTSDTTYYPSGELLWAIDELKNMDYEIASNRYTLAWRFEVKSVDPSFHKAFYVDAQTGNTVKTINLVEHNDAPANVNNYNNQQTLLDIGYNGDLPCFFSNNCYQLLTKGSYRNIETRNWGTEWSNSQEEFHDDQDWTDCSCDDIASVHWYVQQSWDYFNNIHSWNGMDGIGSRTQVGVTSQTDAKYGGNLYTIIVGGIVRQTLDVVAHEFTHGVTEHSSQLYGTDNETGALDESFADIFGVLTERYVEGNMNDWRIGEDGNPDPDLPVRSLQDPNNDYFHYPDPTDCNNTAPGQPDTYEGQFWYPINTGDNCDDGGEHVNAGVQNHWFYLLAVGGSGTNDNGWNYNVQGIGIDKAAKITFYNLINHIQGNSEYEDARQGAIQAAKAIYGYCSFEHRQTQNAWHAVGIGDDDQCDPSSNQAGNELAVKKATLYPNPASDVVHIDFHSNQNRTLTLVSSQGKILDRFAVSKNRGDFHLDLAAYPSGLYLIKVKGNEKTAVHKIIKQ